MYKINRIHPYQLWHHSTAMMPILASITTFTVGCASAPPMAEYTLWFDTTNTVETKREFSQREKDTLTTAIKKLITEYGAGETFAERIDSTDPLGTLYRIDPYTRAYDATETITQSLAGDERYNDNPYGLMLEQTSNGAKIVNIKRSRKCKLQLACGQTISMIGSKTVADLSSDELALALYRAASHGAKIEVLYGSVGKRKAKLPAVTEFSPSFITSTMLDDSTGYVRFNEFSTKIDEWIELVVANLEKQDMKYLVLDMRGNHGGYVDQIVKISKLFSLNTGKDTMDVGNLNEAQYLKTHFRETRFNNISLLVLVDKNTASAAEAIAGAFQDRDRAVIIGEQTFGKGTTISEYELPYRQMLLMSNGLVYLPSGRCIERPYRGSTRCDKRLRFETVDNFNHEQETLFNDTHYCDRYYSRNLRRNLYSRMAIVPDYIVEQASDTDSDIQYQRDFIPRWLAYKYSTRMLDENQRDSITHYFTPDQFAANFVVPDDLMKQVLRAKDRYKLSGDVNAILESELEIRRQFRIALTKELYGMRYYTQERLLADPVVREALKHRDVAGEMVK